MLFSPGSTGSTLNSLDFGGFTGNGITVNSDSNTIRFNHIGVTTANSSQGIIVSADSNSIVSNALSGNGAHGLLFNAASATNNVVQANIIGLLADGTTTKANTLSGVSFDNGATSNTIGGTGGAATRNIISGSGTNGVLILGATTTANTIQGNYIGTDSGGTLDRGNGDTGISIVTGTDSQIIVGNIISGNDDYGIFTQSGGHVIQGNRIGTNATGTADLGNALTGIYTVPR